MDRFGGVQSHILATRNELIKRGHEVKIIAPKPRRAGNSDSSAHVLTVGSSVEIKFKAVSTSFPVAMAFNPKEIKKLLAEENFDILHVHEPFFLMLPYQMVTNAQCPVVGTLHANWTESAVNSSISYGSKPYFMAAVKKIDALTAVSEAAGTVVTKRVKKDVNIVPNGIDLRAFSPGKTKESVNVSEDKRSIVYIGRLEKRKGVQFLIKAYEELIKTHSDIELIIGGAGPTGKSLRAYVKRHKIPNVKFLGFVTEEEKMSLLKSATVYCSPALFGESFGIVLLEAMAMGAVTVAGNNPGYSSVMQGRGRLSLVDPESVNDFAMRLELMLYDQEIRTLWQAWASEYVKKFDYSVVTDQYEAIYKRLTNA